MGNVKGDMVSTLTLNIRIKNMNIQTVYAKGLLLGYASVNGSREWYIGNIIMIPAYWSNFLQREVEPSERIEWRKLPPKPERIFAYERELGLKDSPYNETIRAFWLIVERTNE